jgi:hypothetical protein
MLCSEVSRQSQNDLLVIELYRVLERKAECPTEGKIKAINMIFEDIFRGRSMLEAKISCIIRIPPLWLERSLNLPILKGY